MPEFSDLILRHGESWVQALIERMERYDGIRQGDAPKPLEQRWATLMREQTQHQQLDIAA